MSIPSTLITFMTGQRQLLLLALESMLGCFHINIFISNLRGLMFLKAVGIGDTDGADNVQSKSEGKLWYTFCGVFTFLQHRIFELKKPLQELVVSERWKQWEINIPYEISSIEATILGDDFWRSAHLLRLFEPFVRLLGTLDVDKLVMGDVCDWRVQALEAVKSKDVDNGTLSQLEELIENRDKIVMRGWKATLDRYEFESADRRAGT
ncbi:unnamed protein product [Prunus armeniaca]|uniref:Uncharacterized protein n=1 Tax=Prunus armeniaca TaxID=36596 RepID=A0A6J5XLS8_PRUAR|nr:unnamed protein product [Prunus armeniaca]